MGVWFWLIVLWLVVDALATVVLLGKPFLVTKGTVGLVILSHSFLVYALVQVANG